MSCFAGLVDFIKVKIFCTRKKMCVCDMRAMYRWGFWANCRLCYRIFSWVPVLFILGVVCWSYYAFVYVVTFTVIEDVWLRVLYLFLYHAALVPFLWSYYQIVFKNPGDVPVNFRLSADACERMQSMGSISEQNRFLNEVARGLPLLTRSFDDNVRFCDICAQIKPDRAHHCSVCGKCVLKMDHHCPWVNNCVGYANYKFFILFLFYAFVLCIVIGVSVLPHFIAFWQRSGLSDGLDGPGFGSRFNILFLFFVSVMFAISVSILLTYHIHLVSRNRTTLESFRPPVLSSGQDKNAFDLGCCRNIEQVFGTRKLMWLVPITTCLGDGVIFPARSGLRGTTYAAVEDGARNPLHDGHGGGDAAIPGVSQYTSPYMSNGSSGHPSAADYSLRGVVVDSTRK